MNHSKNATWLDAVIAVLLLIAFIIAILPWFRGESLGTIILEFALAAYFTVSIILAICKKVKWTIFMLTLLLLYVAIMVYIELMKL